MIKEIPEYPGYYASDDGKIYGPKHKFTQPLKTRITNCGYEGINIQRKNLLVHRLVAICFIINYYDKKQINHKNGNRLNNNISNLEWCTNGENEKHAYHILKTKTPAHGERNGNSKLTEEDIKIIRHLHKNNMKQKNIAKVFNVLPNTISRIINKKRWSHI